MRTTISALCLFWAASVSAQAPGGTAPGNELVVSLYNQLQELQNEILTLRGMVEEQGYQLQRLQTESRDRYIDVDRRLSEITLNGTGMPPPGGTAAPLSPDGSAAPLPGADPAAVPGSGVPLVAGANDPTASPAPAAGQQPVLDEQELYRNALNLLLEESMYDEAIAQFQLYIDSFPTGRLLTNALYWQGEALILVARYDEAVVAFNRLLQEFPQDPKAPGAMLKLGVAYDKRGERQQAEDQWRQLPALYPDAATEIKAAQDYLRR